MGEVTEVSCMAAAIWCGERELSPRTSKRAAEVTLYDCMKHDPQYRWMDGRGFIPRKFPDLS